MTLVVLAEEPGTDTVWLPFSHQPLALLRPANAGSAASRRRLRTLILHHRLHHDAHHLVGIPYTGRRADRLPASLDLVVDLVDEQAHVDRHRVDMKHRGHCHILLHHNGAGLVQTCRSEPSPFIEFPAPNLFMPPVPPLPPSSPGQIAASDTAPLPRAVCFSALLPAGNCRKAAWSPQTRRRPA